MNLDSHWQSALDGTTFSPGDSFRVTTAPGDPFSRFDAARQIARGRRVLHVGCVDHLPLIDEKIASGTWMHGILSSVATVCGGIDTNAEGIEALRARGYGDLWVGDPSNVTDADLLARNWDVLFLGEMLEHVDNPVMFLHDLRQVWGGKATSVVVTVPNAFSWPTLLTAVRKGSESINTDHRYWFTPFTIAKVAQAASFSVTRMHLCESFDYIPSGAYSNAKQNLLKRILQRRPILRNVIIAELTF